MESGYFLDDAFHATVREGTRRACRETLRAGRPVFYRDYTENLDVMEQPDGRRFEIRFIPGAPGDRNYEVLREIGRTAT